MPHQKILHKRNTTNTGVVPSATGANQLAIGELAINAVSNKVFLRNTLNQIVELKAVAAGTSVSTTTSTTAPTSPSRGDIWVDTSLVASGGPAIMKFYQDTPPPARWVTSSSAPKFLSAAQASAGLTAADAGSTWYNAATNQLMVWSLDPTTGTYKWIASSTAAPSATAPASPTVGQSWFDTSIPPGQMMIWNGTKWVPSSSPMPQTGQPASPSVGQLWWDSTNNVLMVWDGTAWVDSSVPKESAVAPSSPVPGTQWFDTASGTLKYWNGTEWVSSEGVDINETTTNAVFYPLMANTTSGIMRASFINSSRLSFNPSTGVHYATTYNTTTYQINGTSVIDANRNLVNIANAGSANAANTYVIRDGSGNFSAGIMTGLATSARYADLAEKYLTDKEYPPGTVVYVGGDAEVTASRYGYKAIGAVSTNPAYMMNSELEGGTYIALKGRIPLRVNGPVSKGDGLVPGDNGTAQRTFDHSDSLVFAIALESSTSHDEKLIEAVIL